MAEDGAPAAGFVATAYGTIAHRAGGSGDLSIMDAARSITDARRKLEAGATPLQQQDSQAESAEPEPAATAEPELAEQANADQPQADPGEVAEEAEPEADKLPPIERPRSWAKDLDEEWNSYPREAQMRIAQREQERDTAIRRSQNEAAEARKAAQAQQAEAEKARQEYLNRIPSLEDLQRIVDNGPFADIKTLDDANKLAENDPFRYLQWDAYQKRLQGLAVQAKEAQELKARDESSRWMAHISEQNAKFEDTVPEAERATLAKMRDNAPKFLTDKGFSSDELNDLAAGKSRLSIYDHRIQALIRDGMKLQEILNAPKAVAAKPVPPVQRPGVAPQRGSSAQSEIQELQKQLATATGVRAMEIGAKITNLRRAAR